jgi:hypothetical protein
LSRVIASLLATVALVMGGVAVVLSGATAIVLASPGTAAAVTDGQVSYEADCTTSFESGVVAPFATALDGDTSVDTADPTGATFGFSGTSSTELVGPFIANLFANGVGKNRLTLQWIEDIGPTDANSTGSYKYTSPVVSEPDGGGEVSGIVSWAKGATTLTIPATDSWGSLAVGDSVASTTAGLASTATVKTISGPDVTISAPTTAKASKVSVGFGVNTVFTDSTLNTGDTAFTTTGTTGETAGVGVTNAISFAVGAALTLTFGGATGDGSSNCLETGYTAGGTAGPAQTCGLTPACSTSPAFPAGTTTALLSVSPLEFPAAGFVDLQTSDSAPGAPTIGTATAGNASATVSFTPPADDGGSPITGYTVTAADSTTPADGGQMATGTSSPITVPGLTNGDNYTFTVTATNAIGTSDPSTASNAVTPEAPTAPGAPTIGTATAGNANASVSFTAPSSDGGSPITGYTVTAADSTTPANGGQMATGTSSPITVPGLTNGDSYTFTVTATNAIGTSDPSEASNAVTPEAPSVPGAPTIGTATAGNTSATLTWSAPTNQGSSPITGYLITPSSGPTVTVGNVSSDDITGLTNGTAYTFTVSAINDVGTGDPSAASNSVTPEATAPGAPTIRTATAGNATATVNWTAPTSDGGSPITGYVITPSSGPAVDVGNVTTDNITGLNNGTAYTFTVAAINSVGTGDPSAASNAVTPEAPTAPGAPTIGTATAGNASATVNWTAPTSDGGSAITGYVITPSSGPAVTVGNVTSDDVTGLTNGTSYTFTVAATNAIGTGAASAASNAVTPEAPAPPPATPPGYWVITADGGVYPQGSVSSHGSASSLDLNAPIVGSAALPDGRGYWLVGADGGIFSYGDAAFYGSMGSDHLNAPVVGMASTPDGKGYWLVAADGGVFAFGDAAFAGSAAHTHLNDPVVAIVGDGTAGGYWLVAADGGIFSYGNAHFYGSTGGDHLNAPIVGAAAAPGGNGYWLVAADGGVFSFGSAPFRGSAVGSTSGGPVVGISAATGGYVLTTADGGVFAFGAKFFGSEAGTTLGAPVIAIVN